MSDTLKNIARTLLSVNTVVAVRTAVNSGSPNNERITIKRLRVTNVSAGAVTISLWAGTASTDAYKICHLVSLDANGGALELDPTTIVLEPGEILYAQASVANALSVHADGLVQTE